MPVQRTTTTLCDNGNWCKVSLILKYIRQHWWHAVYNTQAHPMGKCVMERNLFCSQKISCIEWKSSKLSEKSETKTREKRSEYHHVHRRITKQKTPSNETTNYFNICAVQWAAKNKKKINSKDSTVKCHKDNGDTKELTITTTTITMTANDWSGKQRHHTQCMQQNPIFSIQNDGFIFHIVSSTFHTHLFWLHVALLGLSSCCYWSSSLCRKLATTVIYGKYCAAEDESEKRPLSHYLPHFHKQREKKAHRERKTAYERARSLARSLTFTYTHKQFVCDFREIKITKYSSIEFHGVFRCHCLSHAANNQYREWQHPDQSDSAKRRQWDLAHRIFAVYRALGARWAHTHMETVNEFRVRI